MKQAKILIPRYFLLLFLLVISCSGCSSFPQEKNIKAIVITGGSLNSHYKNNKNASNFLKEVGKQFSNSLFHDLEKNGVKTHYILINSTSPRRAIDQDLNRGMKDALVQVRVLHEKNNHDNSIYLYADYFKITVKEDKYVFHKKSSERYTILNAKTMKFNQQTPREMAREYMKKLKENNFF